PGTAIVGSLLFAFLPYHFGRHQSHLFLSSYYLIPPAVMMAIWICQDRPLFFQRDEQGRNHWRPRHGVAIISGLICLGIASAGLYYAFFACFLLVVAGARAFFRSQRVCDLNPCCTLPASGV